MYLTQLSLTNFRNYARLLLDLPQHTVVLQGANAQGKTNLLEAIYYLAVGRSPYASSDAQLVNWLAVHDELPHGRVVATLSRGGSLTRIEITLTQNANGRAGYRKHIRINGVDRRVIDLLGHANVVLFVPQDLSLIDGSPEGRRRYLNSTICQIDPHYCRALAQYGRVLEQRNHLLRALRDRGGSRDQLDFWNQRLTGTGAQIIARRQEIIYQLESLSQTLHIDLSGGKERLRLRYQPSVDLDPPLGGSMQMSFGLDLPPPVSKPQDVDTIRDAFMRHLTAVQRDEMQRGLTLVGPHRDDLRFYDGQVDLHIYGSRGQQRTAILALKLAEVSLMTQITGEQPILLLDEVMSELDSARRRYLCAQLDRVEQAVITTTDLDDLTPNVVQRSTLYRVSEGRLSRAGTAQEAPFAPVPAPSSGNAAP